MAIPATRLASQILADLRATANTLVQAETEHLQGARSLYIEAANDVLLTIGNALTAVAYKADAMAQRQLEEVESMVANLQSRREIESLSARAQTVVNHLALAPWQPKLTKINPTYVIIQCSPLRDPYTDESHFKVAFSGVFQYAANKGDCILAFDNLSVADLKDRQLDRLSYRVTRFPKDVVREQANHHCQFFQGKLKVSYSVGMFSALQWATYDVWVGALPLCPGKITVIKRDFQKFVHQEIRSATITLSRKDFPTGTIERKVHVKPTHGWQIDNVPQVHSKGSTSSSYDSHSIELKLKLAAEDNDSVECYVTFKEVRTVIEEGECQEPFELRWGDARTIHSRRFCMKVEGYDGTSFNITETGPNDGYLKVIGLGNGSYNLYADPKTNHCK